MTPVLPPPALEWLAALAQPQRALAWSLAEWQRVIRLARRLRLLGRLAEAVDRAGLLPQLPPPVQQHLLSAQRQSRHRLRALAWTVECVGRLLEGSASPCVLLKGAAYQAQGLPVASGRLPSDLDILVPHGALADAQRRLTDDDWREVELDEHDQRYYREWSHELAPLRHENFAIEVDLHHRILPPVARTTVDAAPLLARLMPSGLPVWRVLCPADQVLHSAAHLFFDSELRDRLRDLVDLDALLRHFGERPVFWADLLARSVELGLEQPLALALHYTVNWLGTPVPEVARREAADRGPGALARAALLPLLDLVLWPTEPDERSPRRQDAAATLLLARHHLQRMPLRLLLPHLWHKARSRRARRDDGDDVF